MLCVDCWASELVEDFQNRYDDVWRCAVNEEVDAVMRGRIVELGHDAEDFLEQLRTDSDYDSGFDSNDPWDDIPVGKDDTSGRSGDTKGGLLAEEVDDQEQDRKESYVDPNSLSHSSPLKTLNDSDEWDDEDPEVKEHTVIVEEVVEAIEEARLEEPSKRPQHAAKDGKQPAVEDYEPSSSGSHSRKSNALSCSPLKKPLVPAAPQTGLLGGLSQTNNPPTNRPWQDATEPPKIIMASSSGAVSYLPNWVLTGRPVSSEFFSIEKNPLTHPADPRTPHRNIHPPKTLVP
jgi:hypothetical protein